MHASMMLSVVGQLVGLPAVLFVFPSSLKPIQHILRPSDQGGSGGFSTAVLPPLASPAASAVLEEPLPPQVEERDRDAIQHILGVFQQTVRKGQANVDQLLQPLLTAVDDHVKKFGHNLNALFGRERKDGLDLESSAETERTQRYLQAVQEALVEADAMMASTGWKELGAKDNISTFKKYKAKSAYGSQFPCIKAVGVLSAPPGVVLDMLVDSSRIKEYNQYSVGRDDLEVIDDKTKVVWNKTQPPVTKKLHDFCTIMHCRVMADGGHMLLTTATDHPKAPLLPNHVRSEILLGLTLLRPHTHKPDATHVTTINHIYSNGAPLFLVDKMSSKNARDFILSVEQALLGSRAAA